MNELLTIIVPVYRVSDTIDRCVESIIAQGYDNMEIILVDDGSPDDCRLSATNGQNATTASE